MTVHHERETTEQLTEVGDGRIVHTWWGGDVWCEQTMRGTEILTATMGHRDRRTAIAYGIARSR